MSDLNRNHNRAVWFDIPVVDLDRAVLFYRDVLGIGVDVESFGDVRFAVLDHEQGNGGCLVIRPDEVCSDSGVLIYLNVDGRIEDAVRKTVDRNGTILEDVHSIGPHGYRAIVRDSEGNRIALHSASLASND